MTDELMSLLERPEALIGALAVSVLLLIWVARRVRKIVHSERPDEPLSNLAMLIGLGWSSEVIWEITRTRLHFPLALTLLVFFVFEVALLLSMMRAKRHVKDFGWTGRFGTTAWTIAVLMSTVAAAASHSLAEAVLRAAIPLVVTRLWWDGVIGGAAKRPESVSSWRWTPRRLLLAIGAIEPGERDVETVHRERLTQQMTKLEFRRRHGSKRFTERRAARLARLSLTADDAVINDVRSRVDRALWFEATQPAVVAIAPGPSVPPVRAASEKRRKVRHHSLIRKVRVTHPKPVIIAAQEPTPDPRSTQEIDDAIRVMKTGDPALSQRRIAHLVRTSDAKVNRALRRKQNPSPPPTVNGRHPELEGATR
jgi:hypothetical protein